MPFLALGKMYKTQVSFKIDLYISTKKFSFSFFWRFVSLSKFFHYGTLFYFAEKKRERKKKNFVHEETNTQFGLKEGKT
jgi:hypothetical protein